MENDTYCKLRTKIYLRIAESSFCLNDYTEALKYYSFALMYVDIDKDEILYRRAIAFFYRGLYKFAMRDLSGLNIHSPKISELYDLCMYKEDERYGHLIYSDDEEILWQEIYKKDDIY